MFYCVLSVLDFSGFFITPKVLHFYILFYSYIFSITCPRCSSRQFPICFHARKIIIFFFQPINSLYVYLHPKPLYKAPGISIQLFNLSFCIISTLFFRWSIYVSLFGGTTGSISYLSSILFITSIFLYFFYLTCPRCSSRHSFARYLVYLF